MMGSTREGARRWKPVQDAVLLAAFETRKKKRGKMSERDFWTLVGGDLRPPVTHSSAKRRWYRLNELESDQKRALEESGSVTGGEPVAIAHKSLPTHEAAKAVLASSAHIADRLDAIEGKLDRLLAALGED